MIPTDDIDYDALYSFGGSDTCKGTKRRKYALCTRNLRPGPLSIYEEVV